MTDNTMNIKDTDFIDIYENTGFQMYQEQNARVSIEKEINTTRCFFTYEENELPENM